MPWSRIRRRGPFFTSPAQTFWTARPFIPYADAIPEASGGFTDRVDRLLLAVDCPPDLLERVPPEKREALLAVLAQDPRPSYQEDPDRVYGMAFAGLQVRFTAGGNMLTVREIEK